MSLANPLMAGYPSTYRIPIQPLPSPPMSPMKRPNPSPSASGTSGSRSRLSTPAHQRPMTKLSDLAVIQYEELPETLRLPELPLIENKAIERAVFTHPSITGKGRGSVTFEAVEGALDDYEKWEFVGDGILNAVVTRVLQRGWPQLLEGSATIVKSHLVSNDTISQLAVLYGLPDRLVVSRSTLSSGQTQGKNSANMFEAYIAGVWESHLHPSYETSTSTQSASSAQPGIPTPPATPALGSVSSAPRTEGQAFDLVFEWLSPIFAQLAEWVIERLQVHARSIDDHLREEETGEGKEEEKKSQGALSLLSEWTTKMKVPHPVYSYEKQENSDDWKSIIVVIHPSGENQTTNAIRSTKKVASRVAAYRMCIELGEMVP